MEKSGAGAAAEIIPLVVRGEKLPNQGLEEMGCKIMTFEMEVV